MREAYGIDQGLGSILGKAKVQVSRLAGALHAASLASAVFEQLIEDDILPGYYDNSRPVFEMLKQTVKDFKTTHRWLTISQHTARAAVVLMNYFVTQKKIYTNRKFIPIPIFDALKNVIFLHLLLSPFSPLCER